jgi:hypothetical protein
MAKPVSYSKKNILEAVSQWLMLPEREVDDLHLVVIYFHLPVCIHDVHNRDLTPSRGSEHPIPPPPSTFPTVYGHSLRRSCTNAPAYVHTHFAVGWVLAVALKRCVLMQQQGKWLHPSSFPPLTRMGPQHLLLQVASCVHQLGKQLALMPCRPCLHFNSVPTFDLMVSLYLLSGVILDKCCWRVSVLLHDVFSMLGFRNDCLF